ncbi:MAG: sel1 repeat family protein [Nitrospina sp.]|nr:sel1 repeat family protein [Nitrospina sp.]
MKIKLMLLNIKAIVIALFLSIGLIQPIAVYADEFEEAVEAVNRRDYETAYKMVVPLAEKGHAAAQLVLGMMYFKGTGVEKNIVEADKWLYIAEKFGQEAGKKNRIFVERQMNNGQISKAHELAKDWLKKSKK